MFLLFCWNYYSIFCKIKKKILFVEMFVDIINVKLLYGKKTYPERAVLMGSGVSMLMQKYYIFLILTIFPKKSDK